MSVPLRWQEPQIIEVPEHQTRRSLRPQSTPLPRTKGRNAWIPLYLLGMAICMAGGFFIGRVPGPGEPALHLVSVPSNTSNVFLANTSVERHVGFVTVTGNVFNRSKVALSNVEIVVELMDAQNRTLKVDSALIADDPLPTGGNSAFSVVVEDDARAARYRVRPRKMFGGTLE